MVFGPKMAIFPKFFFRHYRPEKFFYDILKRKNTFLGYKNKKFKKSKNWHFSKVDNPWFLVQKWPSFQNSFLGTIRQENVFYGILKRKNTFLGYKKRKFKKSKNSHFSKGNNSWFSWKNGHFSNFFFLGTIGQENVFYNILKRKNTFPGYKNKKSKMSRN